MEKTLILLINQNLSGQKLADAVDAIRELHSYIQSKEYMLFYLLDINICTSNAVLSGLLGELWPHRLNLWKATDADQSPYMGLAHLAIKLDADVYQVGDDTGAEVLFENMGIEVTKLPMP